MTTTSSSKTLIIGLSGPSSSGKTTLARLLRQIFNQHTLKLFILHEDDFYKTDTEIPKKKFTTEKFGTRELDDWDCVESLDLPLLKRVLGHVHQTGHLPNDFSSKEDQNAVGKSGVPDEATSNYTSEIKSWADSTLGTREVVICIVDGFLLFPDPELKSGQERELYDILEPLLDLKLFLLSTRQQTIDRRTKRTGYVTLEGFWEDPPGYVEDVVWPNYARDHAWLFGSHTDSEVQQAVDEGHVDKTTASNYGVQVGPGTGNAQLTEILPWAIEQLKSSISQIQ